MRRREPPPTALWMLEHLIPAERNEALAGDLLEVFHGGRSTGWYWRQVCAACMVCWYEDMRARASLLIFALMWTMMAPAWNSFCIWFEDLRPPDQLLSGFGGGWVFPALFLWIILHSLFLWTGILLFGVLNLAARCSIHTAKIKRGFMLAPLVFTPLYGAAAVLVGLLWYSHFEHWQLVNSAFGQITDLRLLADVIRVPYFTALLVALWGAVPRPASGMQFEEALPVGSSVRPQSLQQIASVDMPRAMRFLAFVVIAGMVNSMIAVIIMCRLPELHEPALSQLLSRAVMFVLVGALAGVAGSWVYWENPSNPFRENPPLPFLLFALVSSAGWLWIPAMILFHEQLSSAGALVAMLGAFLLGTSLRYATYSIHAPAEEPLPVSQFNSGDLFEESLYRPPIEVHGYAVAIGVYLACASLATHYYYTAACLLSGSAFLFAWKEGVSTGASADRRHQYKKAVFRLARIAIPAVLVTMWALLSGVAHRSGAVAASPTASANKDKAGKSLLTNAKLNLDGYESVVLSPYPDKKQVLPPVLLHKELLAPGTTRPLVIRFTGPYWFVQPPHSKPGPAAHQAHGTPIGVNIASINRTPLVMQAHQYLSAPVRTSRCREIQVEIENNDNTAGVISFALLLTDGTSPKKPTLYLGQQTLTSSEPGKFAIKQSPVFETLTFVVPENPSVRKFDEISVVLLPDSAHEFVAPKIAIQQFQLFPR